VVFAGKERHSSKTAVIIAVPTIVPVLLIICIYAFYLRVRKPREKDERKSEIGLSFLVANHFISIRKNATCIHSDNLCCS
jgi:hypothetical protein